MKLEYGNKRQQSWWTAVWEGHLPISGKIQFNGALACSLDWSSEIVQRPSTFQ